MITNEGAVPDKDWKEFMNARRLTYNGDVVQRAVPLTWKQVEAALPPKGCCGRIPVVDIAEGPAREYWLNPEPWLARARASKTRPPPGRAHIVKGDETLLAWGLVEHGICRFVEMEELIMIDGEPLLNGLFRSGQEDLFGRRR